jgi:hypothetical protein
MVITRRNPRLDHPCRWSGLAHAQGVRVRCHRPDRRSGDDVLPDIGPTPWLRDRERRAMVMTRLAADARPESAHCTGTIGARPVASTRVSPITTSNRSPDVGPAPPNVAIPPDLDLVVHDGRDSIAAYGLFWYDPETATGLVEPMRTEDDHQRRGLARSSSPASTCSPRSAQSIKICFEPDNPASRALPQRRLRTRHALRRLLTPSGRGTIVSGPVVPAASEPDRLCTTDRRRDCVPDAAGIDRGQHAAGLDSRRSRHARSPTTSTP